MRRLLISSAIAGTALLAACERAPTPAQNAPTAATRASAPSATVSTHDFKGDIDAADFMELVKQLASDRFEGRGPGTQGEALSVDYISQQMQRIGLSPGNGDSWFQTVPMTVSKTDPSTTMTLTVNGTPRTLTYGTDMVVATRSGEPEIKVDGSELVFVGYGVDAPEQKWNDYAGVDVKGKTVVMFVNDPGFHSNDPSLFEGKRMTYYGRWTYKFEEAARKGAKAAILIHDDAGASYGWDVVRNSWSGDRYDLLPKDDPEPRVPVQGWITGEQAKTLFADAGLDIDAQRRAAGKRGFKAVPMKATLSVDLKTTSHEASSKNVIGVLPGTDAAAEAVVYMAHWDHLGKHEGETADKAADVIYNGAVDNATGVAGILEIAAKMAAGPRPKRSVVFLAVTLEESGLLGSKYYVNHPVIPLDKTAAVINLDAMPVIGRARDMTVIGKGNSELEDHLAAVAKTQNRTLSAEATPQDGFYFRSDHFNFAKAGVPALYAKGGIDLLEGGSAAGSAAMADYNKNRYHKPSDQFDAAWKVDGVMEDLQALYTVGIDLANHPDIWPNWTKTSAFRATRDAMMKAATSTAPTLPATPAAPTKPVTPVAPAKPG